MSQLTFYLDEATLAMMEQAAKSSGMPKSRWVANHPATVTTRRL